MLNDSLEVVDKEIFDAIQKEHKRQNEKIELIASENFASKAVMEAMGSVFTNKYAEGYPGKRYYGGCQNVDVAENLARDRAKEIFGAEHANVQPHSGAQANMSVYFTVLNPGDTILGMNLSHGGHLTHGSPVNFSGKMYNIVPYGVNENGYIDYDEVEKIALECKPKIIVAGASAYPRTIDFKRFREIADKVSAYLMVDMAHIAGLVAAGLHPSPVPYADFVTTTTHKTLRGPRGGMILCKEKYAKDLDKSVFPGVQGGPLMHVIAAKAVAFKEALSDEFREYQAQIIKNSKALCEALMNLGYKIVSNGTDNHLYIVNVKKSLGITGKEAEKVLDKVGITCNKNTVPYDTEKPMVTSGIRLGTPAVTTRGFKEKEMELVANLIDRALKNKDNEGVLEEIHQEVYELTSKFPIYK